jgi:two-component system response regulator YesN
MARACELLRDTEIKVPDVAWRVGYPDPKRFAGIFGQTLGLSPTAYRRQYRTV